MDRVNNFVVGSICIIVILLFGLVFLNCKRTYYVPEGFTAEGSNTEESAAPVKSRDKKKKRAMPTVSAGPDISYSEKIAANMAATANKADSDHAANTERIKGEIVSVTSSLDKPKKVKIVAAEAESEVSPQDSIKSAMEATKDVSFPTDYPSSKIDASKVISELSNPISKVMNKVGALSVYFANPQVWVDVISQARMSPTELARRHLDKEIAERKAAEASGR
jgi:hypothetical protein